MSDILGKINQDWSPIKWTETTNRDNIRTFVTICNDVVVSCQYSAPEYGLYAFKIEGTEENIKNFVLNWKG